MLTSDQLALLQQDMAADPLFNVLPQNSDTAVFIATAYNFSADPPYWAWRTYVSRSEYTSGVSVDATTFSWVGNGFIARSAGEHAAWAELFADGQVNPSLENVRQAFQDIFSGTGNAAANRTHMAAVSRRLATRAERLYATGTGSPSAPCLLTWEGQLSGSEVEQAWAL